MFEMYDGRFLVMAVIVAGTVSFGAFLVATILIPLLQKWWSYATMTKVVNSWGVYLMVKTSFHKFKDKKVKNHFRNEERTETVIVDPFGKEKEYDTLWLHCMAGSFFLPVILFLGLYFWEIALILGVLALLTKVSRMVITVKRKLESHMVDPKAHQDK